MLTTKDAQWLSLCNDGSKIFSTCAKKQFFCLIVNEHNQIIGQGYNGVPPNMQHCIDGGCPRYINNVASGTPYDTGLGICYSAHAEQNALSRGQSLEFHKSTLYINGFPCFNCAKQIASSGIKRICAIDEPDRINKENTLWLFEKASIELLTVIGIDND